jgi:hypothetical protein
MATIKTFNKRLESLKSERSSFIPLWRELSDNHLAHRGRFLSSDRNKGHRRNTKQYNNTSHLSARTLASGMMAGITSPARPWFRLSSGDSELDESANVKAWLHKVQSLMYRVYSSSNTYNTLHMVYSELGVFGTAAMGVFADYENVIRCKPYTVGSYCVGVDGHNRPDSFYREYEHSVAQVVKQFGYDQCSISTQRMWDNGNTEAWVPLVHAVEPNDDRDHNSPMAKDMPTRSVYYERSAGGGDKFLRESGFKSYPILTPRWDIAGEDIYATDCPGMTALGDTKALQLGERRMYQALDKVVDPPMQGPVSMRNKVARNIKPGDMLWLPSTDQHGFRSVYDHKPDFGAMMTVNDRVEERVKRAFYEDLFLMLANSDRRQITAREVAEKHEEKLLMLGPVLERLHTELLDPLIDRTFELLQEGGVLPPPPEELGGRELNIEYVSVLAQAQRLVNTGAIEQLAAFTGNLVQIWPEARHKVDGMQLVDDYAEALGVNPKTVRSDDEAGASMAADAKAAQQQQAAEQAQSMAQTAKTASETDIGGDNALTATLERAGLQ